MNARLAGVTRAVATAAVVVALDQATKQAAVGSLTRGETVNVFFGLDLTNTQEQGSRVRGARGRGAGRGPDRCGPGPGARLLRDQRDPAAPVAAGGPARGRSARGASRTALAGAR